MATIQLNVSESFAVSDTQSRTVDYERSLSDTFSIVPSYSRVAEYFTIYSDAFSLDDSAFPVFEDESELTLVQLEFVTRLVDRSYTDGFFDGFLRLNKIASSSNVQIQTASERGEGTGQDFDRGKVSPAWIDEIRIEEDASLTTSNAVGTRFQSSSDMEAVTVHVSAFNQGSETVYLTDDTGSVLDSTTTFGRGTEVTLRSNMSAGSEYWVVIDGSGSFDAMRSSTSSIENTSDFFQINGGIVDAFGAQTDDNSNVYGFHAIEPRGTFSNGQIVGKGEVLDSVPNKLIIEHEAEFETDTDIQYTVRDSNSNTQVVDRSQIGDEIDISHFTSPDIDVVIDFITSGLNAPTLETYNVILKEPTEAALRLHSSQHEDGGEDEINVGGLSGQLADPQLIEVEEDGSLLGTFDNINFGGDLVASDDGDGTATVSLTTSLQSVDPKYGTVSGIAPSSTATIISYSASSGEKFHGLFGNGEGDGKFFVEINGSTEIVSLTNQADPNAEFFLETPISLSGGDTVELKVTSQSPQTRDYEGGIFIG